MRFLQFFRRGIPDSWLCRRYSCSRCWRFPRSPGRCVSWLWVTSRHFRAAKVKQMLLFLKMVQKCKTYYLKNSNKCKHQQYSILLSLKGHNSCQSSILGNQSRHLHVISLFARRFNLKLLIVGVWTTWGTYHSYCRFLGADCLVYYWTHWFWAHDIGVQLVGVILTTGCLKDPNKNQH